MQVFRELFREEFQWVTFAFDADMVDDPEPYKSLVLERQRCLAKQAFIAQAQLTGGRKRWQLNEHAQKHADITSEYFGTPAVYVELMSFLRNVLSLPSVNRNSFAAFA